MSGEVRLVRSVRASRAELFRACSTAGGLESWYADRVAGTLVRGGLATLSWPDLGASIELEVSALVPDERIVFRNAESCVTLEVGEGKIALQHAGLTDEDDVEGFSSSWRMALAVLTHALEAHRGHSRRARWVARSALVNATQAHLWFTEPQALRRWLGEEATVGAEGEPYSLVFGRSERMSGRVLARAEGRDLALSWAEHGNSVLVLRTLPSSLRGDARVLAASWSAWGRPEPGDNAVVNELDRALERLAGILATSGNG